MEDPPLPSQIMPLTTFIFVLLVFIFLPTGSLPSSNFPPVVLQIHQRRGRVGGWGGQVVTSRV
jgi:hypothetical protein